MARRDYFTPFSSRVAIVGGQLRETALLKVVIRPLGAGYRGTLTLVVEADCWQGPQMDRMDGAERNGTGRT